MSELALIWAMTDDRVIGRGGALPWHLPEDLKRFKALTLGHAIIMGRATHESIGKALPGRRNVVVSRRPGATFPGCEVAASLDDALALARRSDARPFVIGGAQLYAAALPQATHLFVTHVEGQVPGDTYFPPVDWAQWQAVRTEARPGLRFVDYERRAA